MTQYKNLVDEYIRVYSKVRGLINDEEIYPNVNSEEFEEFVSKRAWVGIPSFHNSMKELKKSDKGHITFRIQNDKIIADLFFHKTAAVERFVNILQPFSRKEFKEFFELLSKLDARYVIELQYDFEKLADTPAVWKSMAKHKCEGLNEDKIKDIILSIKELINKRKEKQGTLPKSMIATISVAIGRVESDKSDDEQLRDIFQNLANLTRITHNLKSNREIRKLEKRIPSSIVKLEEEIKTDEDHLYKVRGLKGVKGFDEIDDGLLEKQLNVKKKKLEELRSMNTSISKQDSNL